MYLREDDNFRLDGKSDSLPGWRRNPDHAEPLESTQGPAR